MYDNWLLTLPKSEEEIKETNFPHYIINNEIVLCQNLPDTKCKKCYGLGYKNIIHKGPLKNKKVPYQPNQLCPCGSNKKFKKCCSDIFEKAIWSGGHILPCSCTGFQSIFKKPDKEELLNKIREQIK